MFEFVPKASEGRDREVIDRLASAAGAVLLDVHADPNHHRSVFTLGDAIEAACAEAACDEVRRRVSEHGTDVAGVEVVGLVPEAEFDAWSETFRSWSGIERSQTIESRLAR